MSVEEFLLTVQTHALPWLVLTKRKEVVQKIAEARGEEDAWQPCWENVNLGAVLVLLLTQDAPDADEFAMSHLRYISPHFNHMSLADLLRAEPVMTALGLLKALGEADGAKKHRVSVPYLGVSWISSS